MKPWKTRKEGQNPKNPKQKRKSEIRTIYLYYKEQRRWEKRHTSKKATTERKSSRKSQGRTARRRRSIEQ